MAQDASGTHALALGNVCVEGPPSGPSGSSLVVCPQPGTNQDSAATREATPNAIFVCGVIPSA